MIYLKKAAMFGLESRTLKKQFGKLFLVRMQSVDSQETRGARIQSNRAAMFGLDARIALAIFGALSVISGAALYSAIQDADATAAITDAQEIAKAFEQYYLDTGHPLTLEDGGTGAMVFTQVVNLVTNDLGDSQWRGPYINPSEYTEIVGSKSALLSNKYSGMRVFLFDDNKDVGGQTGVDSIDYASAECTSASSFCSYYVNITIPTDISRKIDLRIDGASDYHKGNIKYHIFADPSKSGILIKSIPASKSTINSL